MNRAKLREKLLEKLLELLADRQHSARGEDGTYDPSQRKRIERVGSLIAKLQGGQGKRT
jgi:hypothetical protein